MHPNRAQCGSVTTNPSSGAAPGHPAPGARRITITDVARAAGVSIAVVSYALAEIAPRVTLYVNDFNTPARATYRKVGFRQVGEVMSVLF